MKTPYQVASYGIAYDFGRSIKETGVDFDVQLIIQGLQDAMTGSENKVPPEQFRAAMMQLQPEIVAKQQAAMQQAGDKAGEEGAAFRAENAKKEGVITTASGLQIQTLTEGTGASPKASDTAKVHYTGTLIDGSKFDSSVDRGEPATFPLNGVIRGWTEGLQLMKVGGKARLVIPPEIGYGPQGSPPRIPPNATLVFEVELLDIVSK